MIIAWLYGRYKDVRLIKGVWVAAIFRFLGVLQILPINCICAWVEILTRVTMRTLHRRCNYSLNIAMKMQQDPSFDSFRLIWRSWVLFTYPICIIWVYIAIQVVWRPRCCSGGVSVSSFGGHGFDPRPGHIKNGSNCCPPWRLWMRGLALHRTD